MEVLKDGDGEPRSGSLLKDKDGKPIDKKISSDRSSAVPPESASKESTAQLYNKK